MSQIAITFDTVEKTATATIDGTAVDNFQCANIYCIGRNYDEYGIELTSAIRDNDNSMHTCTRVCASEGQLVDQKEDNILDQATRLEVQQYFGLDDA